MTSTMMKKCNKIFTYLFLSLFTILCVNADNFVNLNDLAKSFQLQIKLEKDKIYLSDSKNHWVFQENSKEAFFNNIKIFLTYPIQSKNIGKKNPQKINSIHFIDKEKLIKILQQPKTFSIRTIVIDPGHGGKAEGAINKNLNIKEKDLNLKIAKKLSQQLKNLGFVVYLTRDNDKDLSLKERSEFANKKKADILLSIHHNSSTSQTPCGIEVYSYSLAGYPSTDRNVPTTKDKIVAPVNMYDKENILLAFNLQKNIIEQTKLNDRGVRKGRMGVLNGLKCPGVLIECGFISNLQEAKILLQENYQKKLVQGICNAIQQCNNVYIFSHKVQKTQTKIKKNSP